jgi:hypothetical protein
VRDGLHAFIRRSEAQACEPWAADYADVTARGRPSDRYDVRRRHDAENQTWQLLDCAVASDTRRIGDLGLLNR